MFESAIKGANTDVMEAYSQAADQYQDVLKLEESMQELHQVGEVWGLERWFLMPTPPSPLHRQK